MEAAVKASPLAAKYAAGIDRESARELLAKKLEEGARKAAEDARVKEMAREQKNERVTKKSTRRRRRTTTASYGRREVHGVQGLHAHRGPRDRAGDVQVRSPLRPLLQSPGTGDSSGYRPLQRSISATERTVGRTALELGGAPATGFVAWVQALDATPLM